MLEKKIGKIKYVRFGFGGYQDAQFGITFDIGSDKESWGVGDFWGQWAERSEHAKWSISEWDLQRSRMIGRIIQTLKQAKVDDISKLKGIPVEVTFEGNTLKSWRILEEVI